MAQEEKPALKAARSEHFVKVAAAKLAKRVVVEYLESIRCPFLADLYAQEAVSEGGVARRSIDSISLKDRTDLIREAERMNYPAFIMDDQIVVLFTEDAVVKQVAGRPVVKG